MELKQKDFRGITMKDINNYIDTINIELNEHIKKGVNWPNAVKNLMEYLNAHHFVENEGITINDETIDYFINRIISENKTDDLNFLPDNKLDSEMNQEGQPQQRPVNPLEQLVQNTITPHDLLGIYNRYAPQPLTYEQAQAANGGDENLLKANLINQILSRARDGTLVTRGNAFGKPVDRKGMPDLARIVLDLQRDIKRVKNAISPQGAQAIVDQHNATSKPSAHWKLNKLNAQGPATLSNLSDLNQDGIPDVVISNANNQPIFVNGYTTTNSNYPVDLAYYNRYPTRDARRGHSLNDFKNELYNVTYDLNNADFSKRGEVTGFAPHVEYLEGYDMNKFHLTTPKRMTSFNRFKKFVAQPYIDEILRENNNIPAAAKLALSSKACAAAWNSFVLEYIYQKYGVVTESDRNRIKKKASAEIDARVDNVFYSLHNTGDNWSEEMRSRFENEFRTTLINALNNQGA